MDSTAVRLAADGQPPRPVDDRRFDALYRDRWWPMLRLAQGLVDDVSSAEDVVQDAFAGLYRHWNRADLIADPEAAARYLRASVVNGARSALRRRRTVRAWLGGLRAADEPAPGADEPALRSAGEESARRALAALPGRQREVLTLRFLADLTDAEIAEATGMSAAHVRSAASRGLATLRATLRTSLGGTVMTDFDTTGFDTTVKTLVNSAVDRELAGHRVAPPFDRTGRTGRISQAPAGRTAGWAMPLLAASAVALLAVGSIVAIDHNRARPSGQPGTVVGPAPSISQSVDPDQAEAARVFAEAVAGAREASEVEGVTVGPISESDAARFENAGFWSMPGSAPATPEPGRSYPITVRYVVGYHTDKDGFSPTAGVSVVSGELNDVADGSCPQPFLVRPGHTYLIECQVTFQPGTVGALTFTDRNPGGSTSATFGLPDQTGPSASTSPSPDPNEAARAYSEALARAAEASKVAGVSDRPATADELGQGEIVGTLEGAIVLPEPGKSYSMTLIYIPPENFPAVAVLTIRLEDVAAGHCPGPLRVRAGHAYQFRCQVTFRPGAHGTAYFTTTGPQGSSGSSGFGLSVW